MCKDNQRMTQGGLTRRRLLLAGAASGAALSPRNFGLFTPAIAQSNPLRIGVMAPLSGVYASLGTANRPQTSREQSPTDHVPFM